MPSLKCSGMSLGSTAQNICRFEYASQLHPSSPSLTNITEAHIWLGAIASMDRLVQHLIRLLFNMCNGIFNPAHPGLGT